MGSSPTRVVIMPPWRNWIAHRTSNPGVEGSNPSGGVFFINYLFFLFFFFISLLKKKKVIHSRFVRVILAQGPC